MAVPTVSNRACGRWHEAKPVIAARDLEQWVERNRARLATQGVAVWFGSTMRVGRQAGPTWISFVSRTANARVIRTPDGSCDFDARRFDGALLQHERRTTTTTDDIDAMALLITSPTPLRTPLLSHR